MNDTPTSNESTEISTPRSVPTKVAPGIWAIPVRIPVPSLEYVIVYALESDSGIMLVDSGWDWPDSWDDLCHGMQTIGASVDDVVGVAVTHVHPDHYGLTRKLREATDCWIGLHPADGAFIARIAHDEGLYRGMSIRRMREAGVPKARTGQLFNAQAAGKHYGRMVPPDREINDGDILRVAGLSLTAIHTPGHSPGHLCYSLPDRGIVFTGDHILPRISPSITIHPPSGPRALADFLASLKRVRGMDFDLALPAHGWPFTNVRERINALLRHHEIRLEEALGCFEGEPRTAWDICSELTWSRPLSTMSDAVIRLALGETYAHLLLLEQRGQLVRSSTTSFLRAKSEG